MKKKKVLDLRPDCYVRRYWDEVPHYDEATTITAGAGAVLEG